MKEALQKVVHLPLCVQYGEGTELSRKYFVGSSYPVFVLTDAAGDIIQHWFGYGGARQFVTQLNSAMADRTTIWQRETRFQTTPEFRDALVLAKFYSDTRQYMKAITYYKKTEELIPGGKADYSYQIFTNTANAVWNDSLTFDALLAAADAVLKNKLNKTNVVNAVKLLGRAARKKDQTDHLKKYLLAGLEATAAQSESKMRDDHLEFRVDTVLYVTGDTASALRLREAGLGEGWRNDPQKFYPYAVWCLERRLNLGKAEQYARTALDWANPGAYKATVLHTLAQICEARKNLFDAVRFMEMAVEEDPSHAYYAAELERMRRLLEKKESPQ